VPGYGIWRGLLPYSVCYLSFCTPKESNLPLGRQKYPEKSDAFAKLCNFLISNKECQFSLIELSDKLRYYLPDNIENYSIKLLNIFRECQLLFGDGSMKVGNYTQCQPCERLPAPDELLNVVSCNCKATCSGKCSCVRAGLRCSHLCNSALVLTEEDLASIDILD
jgi:hypothetical protein